jgi:hypothetical protein
MMGLRLLIGVSPCADLQIKGYHSKTPQKCWGKNRRIDTYRWQEYTLDVCRLVCHGENMKSKLGLFLLMLLTLPAFTSACCGWGYRCGGERGAWFWHHHR